MREVEKRKVLAKVADMRRQVLEDDLVPIALTQEGLREVEPNLGGHADAAGVGDFDGEPQLT
eukprot:6925915-Alexandrium_andersonii.AAC.1